MALELNGPFPSQCLFCFKPRVISYSSDVLHKSQAEWTCSFSHPHICQQSLSSTAIMQYHQRHCLLYKLL
jgi:hypothetical protein